MNTCPSHALSNISLYKDHVKDVVLNWPTGCDSGKRDFLETLGIETTEKFCGDLTISINIPLNFEFDPNKWEVSEIADRIVEEIAADIPRCIYIDDDIGDIMFSPDITDWNLE
jgi:hypothetical protein